MKARAIQVVDLGFGDSGKGSLVDYLTARHQADLIVRFNGGPQAGHNVVLADGRHHTFAQFGSGMFVAGARTLLSRFMLVEPYAMLNEAVHLASLGVGDVLGRTLVDGRCRVITPPQQIANRVRERARGANGHGTCGMGVGECVGDSISEPGMTVWAAELRDRATVQRKLRKHLEYKRSSLDLIYDHATDEERRIFDDPSWIDSAVELYHDLSGRMRIISAAESGEIVRASKSIIFEGAQGVLLDEHIGFQPNTTWSKTTYENADAVLEELEADVERLRIGVIRCYLTRHGTGPLITENGEMDRTLPEAHNDDGGWPGKFRRGILDLVMLRYAIAACGRVDGLAVTCLDRIGVLPELVCDGYAFDGNALSLEDSVLMIQKYPDQLRRAKPRYRYLCTQEWEGFLAGVETSLGIGAKYGSFGAMRSEKRELLRMV